LRHVIPVGDVFSETNDLIYEGIATAADHAQLHHPGIETNDLIYEGIATSQPRVCCSLAIIETNDLIYEGIATARLEEMPSFASMKQTT